MGIDTTGFDPVLALNGGVFCRETIPGRVSGMSDLAAPTTQVMSHTAVPLLAGDVITTISFLSGATAAGTPTNWWFALYDTQATPALLGQTADQTSTAWAANTKMAVALASPVLIKVTGVYYVTIMMKATTVVSLVGETLFHLNVANGLVTGQKVLCQSSGSALTATAPATIASPTSTLLRYYATLN